MNITEIKEKLGYTALNLNPADDADGNQTEWMRHWDNDNRVAVSIHNETISAIKTGTATTLDIQVETRTGSKGEYTAKRIVMYTPPALVL